MSHSIAQTRRIAENKHSEVTGKHIGNLRETTQHQCMVPSIPTHNVRINNVVIDVWRVYIFTVTLRQQK